MINFRLLLCAVWYQPLMELGYWLPSLAAFVFLQGHSKEMPVSELELPKS